MANTVRTRTLLDGPRHAVIHVYLLSDGVAGDVVDAVAVDVSTLSPAPSKVTIEEVWWDLAGFDAMLEFDATTDTPAWKLSSTSGNGHRCFTNFGGIKDDSGTGSTGDILISTAGMSVATDEGTVIIKVRKD